MAYPYGMKYSRLTFSQPLTVSGKEADSTKITITPTRRVVWRDSGRPVEAFTETVQAVKGQPGSVTAPYVDQPGFSDMAGGQVTGWAYKVVRTAAFDGQTQVVEKTWAPLVGQETVDFDLLPSTDSGTPTTVQAPEVLSVAGATGAVSTDYLAERLAPWMDAKMAEYEPADGIIPAVAAGIMTPDSDVQEAVDLRAKRAADTAAAPKLDKTTAASTYATKTAVALKLDADAAAGTYQTKPEAAAAFEELAEGIGQLTPTNRARPVGKGELGASVKDYGAVGDGATSDSAAIAQAHAENGAVYYPPGNYVPGAVRNIYGSTTYTNAIGPRWMAGTLASPTADARPLLWAQKHSAANRDTNPLEWDNGVLYGALMKESGNAFGAAVTGYSRHGSAEGGQVVGVHGRVNAMNAASEVWGGWFYGAAPDASIIPKTVIGIELDMCIKHPDQGWQLGGASGSSFGMLIATADGGGTVTQGLVIGSGMSAPTGKFWTGALIKGGSIMPSGPNSATAINNGEAIRIGGAAAQADGYTGIRFHAGQLRTGISFTEATFANNAAIVLGDGHRIVVGPGAAAGRYVEFSSTNAAVNFKDMTIQFNGTQVVSGRKTGWAAPTGTTEKSSWATYSAPIVSATPTQAEVQALANHVQTLSRRLAALQNDLTNHGLIGA